MEFGAAGRARSGRLRARVMSGFTGDIRSVETEVHSRIEVDGRWNFRGCLLACDELDRAPKLLRYNTRFAAPTPAYPS